MYDCDCFVDCFLSGRSGSFQPWLTHLSSLVDGLQSQAKTKMQDFGPRVDGCWWVNCHTNVLSVYINHTCQCTCLCESASCLCVRVHAPLACVAVYLRRLTLVLHKFSQVATAFSFFTGHEWVGGGDQNDQFSFLRILVFLLWNVSFAINIITILQYWL